MVHLKMGILLTQSKKHHKKHPSLFFLRIVADVLFLSVNSLT